MKNINHAERGHCELSPSSSKRWIACPGSIALSRGVERVTSFHAAEGTAAHELAERCLRLGVDAETFRGTEIGGFGVSEEMADAVQVYVDTCRQLMNTCSQHWIEQRITLASLNPPAPMYGTADFVALGDGVLYVVDLKYGKGVEVDPEGNTQLLYYALGAYLVSTNRTNVREVQVSIVQPRIQMVGGPVRTVTYSVDDLIDFAHELLDAADAALQEGAPRHAGDHCRWCPGVAICPEQRMAMQQLAMVEFAQPVSQPPAPAQLTLDQLRVVLTRRAEIIAWLKSVENYARTRMRGGGEVPGMKLVETRPTRRWAQSEAAIETELRRRRFKVGEIFEPRALRSPAQVEKASGRKVPEELVCRVSSGLSIVPETDKRPAAQLTAAAEFGEGPDTPDPFE